MGARKRENGKTRKQTFKRTSENGKTNGLSQFPVPGSQFPAAGKELEIDARIA
jgi:hypothetical protein